MILPWLRRHGTTTSRLSQLPPPYALMHHHHHHTDQRRRQRSLALSFASTWSDRCQRNQWLLYRTTKSHTTTTTMPPTAVANHGECKWWGRSTFMTTTTRSSSSSNSNSNSSTSSNNSGGGGGGGDSGAGYGFFSRLLSWYSYQLDTRPLLTKAMTSGFVAGMGDWLCQTILSSPPQTNHIATNSIMSGSVPLHNHHKDFRKDEDEKEETAAKSSDTTSPLHGLSIQRNEQRSLEEEALQSSRDNITTQRPWDYYRTGRFAFLGCFLVAPAIHVWYGVLARFLPRTRLRDIIQRVMWDQFFFTPLFLPIWLTSMWTLEEYQGSSFSQRRPVASMSTEESGGEGGDNDYDDAQFLFASTYLQRLQDKVPDILLANWLLWIPAMAMNFRFVPLKYQVLCSNIVSLVWNMYLSFTTRDTSQGNEEE